MFHLAPQLPGGGFIGVDVFSFLDLWRPDRRSDLRKCRHTAYCRVMEKALDLADVNGGQWRKGDGMFNLSAMLAGRPARDEAACPA